MASFDFGQITSYAVAITPRSGTFSANINSVAVDTADFEGVAVVTSIGDSNIGTANDVTLSFYESDDNTRANATAVAAARVIYNPTLDSTNTAFWASVVPEKRYLFAEFVPAAAVAANVAVTAALGYAKTVPTTS